MTVATSKPDRADARNVQAAASFNPPMIPFIRSNFAGDTAKVSYNLRDERIRIAGTACRSEVERSVRP